MIHNKITQLIIIIISFLIIPTISIAAGKHALLIAIQDYSNTAFSSLNGPINDINLTKGVLRQRFGFQNEDFIILKDAQATHTGIENAFKTLIQRVHTDDLVYIHYSGHGSQTRDLNGDELRGFDETWVSFGARLSNDSLDKDNYDVLDDEINAWLAAIAAKTENIILVSDSCHSATVSRGQGVTLSRGVEADKRPHILGKLSYVDSKAGIRVGAARDNESAIEFRNGADSYGLFTWHWLQNLQQAQAGDSWYDVFQRTFAQVTAQRGITQQPQMIGERRQQLLGNDFTPQAMRIAVIDTDDSGVWIQAGSLVGVTKDSVYRLYNPQANPDSLPRLKITKVTPFSSYGIDLDADFDIGDLLVEEQHVYHFTPIKVYLEADIRLIRTAFRSNQFPAYALTDEPSQAELRLRLNKQELWVLTSEQRLLNKKLKIPFNNPSKGLKLLKENLNKLASIRELKALKSSKRLEVTVDTTILSPVTVCSQKGAACVSLSDYGLGWYRKMGTYKFSELRTLRTVSKNQLLTFSLQNKSQQDLYCYLINIDFDGSIYAIFPDPLELMEYAKINKGEKRDLEVLLTMEQAGTITLKMLTSRYPIDVLWLEQESYQNRLLNRLNPLERLLVNAVHGLRQATSIGIDDWASGQVTFEVGF